jgi:hypothetical protein
MTIRTLYREANVPKADAITALLQRYPSADILKFVEKRASKDEAKAIRVRPGSKIYEAKIRVSEFPNRDNEEEDTDYSDESDMGMEEEGEEPSKPKPKPKVKPQPAFSDGEEGEDDESHAMSHEEKVEHLLEQILDAIKGLETDKKEEDDLGEPLEDSDLSLPDIGAPEQGEALPPPAQGRTPLPPPVKPKSPGAPAAFSKFDPRLPKVTLVREGVDQNVKTRELIKEAEELFGATHKVARIRRNGTENINGSEVDLPANKLAVVTLVRK